MFHLVVFKGRLLGKNRLQKLPQLGDIPLFIAQIINQLPHGLFRFDFEDLVEGAADHDHPEVLIQGNEGFPNGVDDALGELTGFSRGFFNRLQLPAGLFHPVFFLHPLGDVAEHQHGPDHLTVAIANRRTAVGDGAFAAIAGDENDVVGQILDRALGQGFPDRNGGGSAGVPVDDPKNLFHGATGGFRQRPTREMFGQRIQERHVSRRVGGHDGIADGVEGHGQLFLTDLQGDVSLLHLFIRVFLDLQQMFCFKMNQVFDPDLFFPIDQGGEGDGEQQRQQADDQQDAEQAAHV